MTSILSSSAVSSLPPETPSFPVYRLSVPQYLAMVEHGIFTPEDRVELLHGWLVPKMTPRPPHAVCVDLIHETLARLLPAGWHVRSQAPLILADSVPEPDLCVTRGQRRDHLQHHPCAGDGTLVIEVSDTSLADDRGTKKGLYADAKIPTYWIVNLVDSVLEIYSDPVGGDYATSRVLTANDEAVVVVAGQEVGRVAVRDLLP